MSLPIFVQNAFGKRFSSLWETPCLTSVTWNYYFCMLLWEIFASSSIVLLFLNRSAMPRLQNRDLKVGWGYSLLCHKVPFIVKTFKISPGYTLTETAVCTWTTKTLIFSSSNFHMFCHWGVKSSLSAEQEVQLPPRQAPECTLTLSSSPPPTALGQRYPRVNQNIFP